MKFVGLQHTLYISKLLSMRTLSHIINLIAAKASNHIMLNV